MVRIPEFKKKAIHKDGLKAESQGFEPRVPFGTTVFKTVAFDHSANSPVAFRATGSFMQNFGLQRVSDLKFRQKTPGL